MGSGDGGWGAMWAVTPSMNECIGALFKKYPATGHKLDQKFENIWKNTTKKPPYTMLLN